MAEAPSSPPSPTPEMAETPSSPPSPTPQITEAPSSPPNPSTIMIRKRDGRGESKLPEGLLVITEVSEFGVPLRPKNSAAKFRTMCGVLARKRVPITTPRWKDLTKDQKGALWTTLSKKFTIPEADMARVERTAMLTIAKSWRTFKSILVTQYVNTGQTPFAKYGFLTQETWDAFVAMKTTAEFNEKSAAHKALQSRNTHPHRLGTAGYAGKYEEWAAEEENAFPDVTDPRSLAWLKARAKVSSSGSISFTNPADQEVSQRVVNMSNYLVVNKSITS